MASAPSVTPDAIFQLAQGFMASKLFFTAGEIDVGAIAPDCFVVAADTRDELSKLLGELGVCARRRVHTRSGGAAGGPDHIVQI